MIELYRAGSQLMKVRAVMIVSLIAAVAACWWGWDMFRTYGLRPADGGVLAPVAVRLTWGLGLASVGIAFAVGMWAYGKLYVSAIDYDEAADALHIRTVSFFGSRESVHPVAAVLGSSYVKGRSHDWDSLFPPEGVSVNAPWIKLRIAGRRAPLIVDAQGKFTNHALAGRFLKSV